MVNNWVNNSKVKKNGVDYTKRAVPDLSVMSSFYKI